MGLAGFYLGKETRVCFLRARLPHPQTISPLKTWAKGWAVGLGLGGSIL